MTAPPRAGVGLVWAEAADGVIGADGGIPWHVPEDLAHFREVTMGEPVVMGRRTWDSLPERFRPLPGRRNIVVTRSPEWEAAGAERAGSLGAALETAGAGRVWVIGGGELFREALPFADVLEVTEVDIAVPGDTFAPAREGFAAVSIDPGNGWLTSRTGTGYRFLRLERATPAE
jgi:dihydrofolate reductase